MTSPIMTENLPLWNSQLFHGGWYLPPHTRAYIIPLMELLYHFKIPTFPYRKRKMAGHGQTLMAVIGEQQNILRVTGTLLKLTFKRIIKTQKAENLVIFCFLLLCPLNFFKYAPRNYLYTLILSTLENITAF